MISERPTRSRGGAATAETAETVQSDGKSLILRNLAGAQDSNLEAFKSLISILTIEIVCILLVNCYVWVLRTSSLSESL